MFVKTHELFPIKDHYAFLSHCGISPLYAPALANEHEIALEQCRSASLVYRRYDATLDGLRAAAGQMLRTEPGFLFFRLVAGT